MLLAATTKMPQMPIAYLVCNFTPPVGERPSLLTFRDVETIFHEFPWPPAYAFQRMRRPSGINVSSGMVELPSQFMENWCYHKKTFELCKAL